MISRRVPLYALVIAVLSGVGIGYVLLSLISGKPADTSPVAQAIAPAAQCSYTIMRLSGYSYIRPLVSAEPVCESAEMASIKTQVEDIISSAKSAGTLRTASVYVREFNYGNWISINGDQKYSPGSLLKVSEMIAYLRMNEKNPGTLDKKIFYQKPAVVEKHTNFTSQSIIPGRSYTVRELIQYMIRYSDNNATWLLNQNIDLPTFNKVYTDLGLTPVDWTAPQHFMSAPEYSMFMKVLYNASYLTIDDSEFCTELLGESDFRDGMLSGLPADTKVAHKFGEGGYDDSPQLSESGIIFLHSNAYILTVMTNGSDMKKLPHIIGDISKAVYTGMSALYDRTQNKTADATTAAPKYTAASH